MQSPDAARLELVRKLVGQVLTAERLVANTENLMAQFQARVSTGAAGVTVERGLSCGLRARAARPMQRMPAAQLCPALSTAAHRLALKS